MFSVKFGLIYTKYGRISLVHIKSKRPETKEKTKYTWFIFAPQGGIISTGRKMNSASGRSFIYRKKQVFV